MNLHRFASWWPPQRHSVEYVAPPQTLGAIETEWIPAQVSTKAIREIRSQWYRDDSASLLEALDMIQWEARGGDQFYQPYPDIVLAKSDNQVIGVLAGNPNYLHQYFFIHEMALHPGYYGYEDLQFRVTGQLLEAAIDFSQDHGFWGWVACNHDIYHLNLLRQSGFYPHDEFTYRKMGYFS